MHLDIGVSVDLARRALDHLCQSRLPEAMAWAMNDTAADAHLAMQDEMRTVFDRPTRWTLNAFMVWGANKRSLRAVVQERPSTGSRHFLKVQNTGGTRPQTALERLLAARVAMDAAMNAAVPTAAARRDGHGNWSTGERNQALSGIKAQRDVSANTTDRSARRNVGRRATYFVPKPGSKMAPGIWRRDGNRVRKIVSFTASMPAYQRRVDFHKTAVDRANEVFEAHFARTFAKAMARA